MMRDLLDSKDDETMSIEIFKSWDLDPSWGDKRNGSAFPGTLANSSVFKCSSWSLLEGVMMLTCYIKPTAIN